MLDDVKWLMCRHVALALQWDAEAHREEKEAIGM